MRTLGNLPLAERLGNATISAAIYAGKTLWPTRMAVFYPFPATLPVWQSIVAGLVLVSLTALAIASIRKRPYLTSAALWYAITVLPVIGIVQVGLQSRADRSTYIPRHRPLRDAGLERRGCLESMAQGAHGPGGGLWRGVPGLCSAHVAPNPVLAEQRDTLSTHHRGDRSQRYRARHPGTVLGGRGDVRRSDRGVPERPGSGTSQCGASGGPGRVAGPPGTSGGSGGPASRSGSSRARRSPGTQRFGRCSGGAGRTQEALPHLQEAIRLKPDLEAAHATLGTALANLGRFDEAIAQLSEAVRLNPKDAEARVNLEKALERKTQEQRK